MLTREGVSSHFDETVTTEHRSFTRIRRKHAGNTASQSASERKNTLLALGVVFDFPASPKPTSFPRPSLFLIKQALDLRFSQSGAVDPRVATFLEETLLPIAGLAAVKHSSEAHIVDDARVQACTDAETFFLSALDQLDTGKRGDHTEISVYHDKYGKALALGKTHMRKSALMLAGATADGIHIPPGTVAGIDQSELKNTGALQLDGWSIASYMVQGALPLTPNRITPWAYADARDRAIFALTKSGCEYDEDYGAQLEATSLATFQTAAEFVLSECGIA